MDRSLSTYAAGCISAVILMGATAMSANATYLGYANGDPGNWDLWTEQAGGPKQAAEIPAAPAVAASKKPAHHVHYYKNAQEKHMSAKQ
jgi:hypothetical protein